MSIKPITALFRQDLTNAFRDNILIYMLIAPLIIALGLRFLLPSLEESTLTYAVESAVGPEIIARLNELGDVEEYATREEVIARVERTDDVPGIVPDGDGFTIYLEGNEPAGEELAHIVMSTVLREEAVATVLHEQFRESRSLITEYGAVVLVMLSVMMGAMVMGFLMVAEKEEKVIQALAVSPLTLTQYTLARGFFAVVFSTAVALLGSLIMVGAAVNYALLLVACLVASAVAILLGTIVGGFASNQLEATALIKIVVFAYLTVPLITIFVPAGWQFLFYWLPNYWMFQLFAQIYVGEGGPAGFWTTAALTLLTSALYLALLAPRLRQKMRLRYV